MKFPSFILQPPVPAAELDAITVQPIIERFARAHWIEGLNVSHPKFFRMHMTELGQQRMRMLASAIRPFVASVLDGAPRPNFLQWLRFFWLFRRATRGLRRPAFSPVEINTLMMLAAVYERDPDSFNIDPQV